MGAGPVIAIGDDILQHPEDTALKSSISFSPSGHLVVLKSINTIVWGMGTLAVSSYGRLTTSPSDTISDYISPTRTCRGNST